MASASRISAQPFCEALKEIATAQNLSRNKVITRINQERQHANLSSAIRLLVLDHYRRLAEAMGNAEGTR
jgi:predicted DNA-binding ribbon-helix-helix protein